MKSLYNEREAKKFKNDELALRVYTSRLLGANPALVLHGGGNTSVKIQAKDFFGKKEEILYVKGSGWDLATIEREGFAPVKMEMLLKLAKLRKLTDSDMMRLQRSAMLDPYAPNPSVEAILHAIIPYKFVDHTHADSVVTVTNSPDGRKKIEQIYGSKMLIIPYVMPGFILARKIYEMTRNVDWQKLEGLILMNHGIFTFDDDAEVSYQRMIRHVSKTENYIKTHSKRKKLRKVSVKLDLEELARIRQNVSHLKGKAVIAKVNASVKHVAYARLKDVKKIATRGVLTPDHVIRTKRVPVVINRHVTQNIKKYENDYQKYFKTFKTGSLKQLDSAPRWAVWLKHGTICFGSNSKEARIISDITDHTVDAILNAEGLGGWKALPARDVFDVEYWELEQAKLNSKKSLLVFEGKVVVVTGGASGIGLACVEYFKNNGACVAAFDIDPKVKDLSDGESVLGVVCDITNESSVVEAIKETITTYGGLDVLVNNAGIFPSNERIENMSRKTWEKSLSINLTGQQVLLQYCLTYLKLGIDPTVIFIASKNVPAPGPGASAYSVAKAGLTQLARVAALELAPDGIRVNVVHPNQVFDTAIWTKEVLKNRAKHYGMSVDEYKSHNLLKTKITSHDVAELVGAMAGKAFSKTTGAQVTIDGGNDRTI